MKRSQGEKGSLSSLASSWWWRRIGAALAVALVASALIAPQAQVRAAGTPVAGYTATDFATGFPSSGWCCGPIGVAFDASNTLYVADQANGYLYKFGQAGGAASSATQINSVAISGGATGLTFGKDGKLYLARQSAGDVVQIDTSTGAILRTVATNTCGATGIATDPLSGDLFVSQPGCSNNIVRISNPAGSSPAVTVYASPGSTDGLTFAPDGTLYSATNGCAYRTTGTNQVQPATSTQIACVSSMDGIALAPSSDPSKPYVFTNNNDGSISEIDQTVANSTPTQIVTAGTRGDFVAVDSHQCLYATQASSIEKVTKSDGTCIWQPTGVLSATPTNVDVSNQRGPQGETTIAASHTDLSSLVIGATTCFAPTNPSDCTAAADYVYTGTVYAYNSTDSGQTWSPHELKPSRAAFDCAYRNGGHVFAGDPSVAASDNGNYFLSYLSSCLSPTTGRETSDLDVATSRDGGKTWSVSSVYNTIDRAFQDKPMLTVDNNVFSPTHGRVYAAWVGNDDPNAPPCPGHITLGGPCIALAWSDNNGTTWSRPVQIDASRTHQVWSPYPAVDRWGHVDVIWYDYSTHSIQFAASANPPSSAYTPTFPKADVTLKTTGITSIHFKIPAQPDNGINPDTSLLSDSTGRLYALWSQGQAGSAVIDVELQTSTDGGAHWSAPVQVNDDNVPGDFNSGSSDFLPQEAIDSTTGALHLSFYSTRLDSTNRTANVYDAVSNDGGQTFAANRRITDTPSDESTSNPYRCQHCFQYGDYEGITMQNGVAHIVWTDARNANSVSLLGEEVFSAAVP